jgi:hypothetical protein
MKISDEDFPKLLAALEDARRGRDEVAALVATLTFLESIGVDARLLDPLYAVFLLLLTSRSKKIYGNRSLPPTEVMMRAAAAAEVLALRQFKGNE